MESLHKAGNVMLRMEQAQRRRRSKTKKNIIRTAAYASAGVIDDMRFMPLLSDDNDCSAAKGKEKEVREALHQANELLGTKGQDDNILPFPVNVVVGFANLQTQVRQRNPDAELILLESSEKIRIAIIHRYHTGNTLFYIPILPLYHLLRKDKKCGELLLAVCSYLARFSGIPYHRNDDTYMYWQYKMLSEWLFIDEGEWDPESFSSNAKEIRTEEIIGDIMGRKIFSPAPLDRFQYLLQKFKPMTSFEWECKKIADIAYALWTRYPQNYISQNMVPAPECDPDSGYIDAEKYISFVHSFDGWLGEMMMESVNNELNEYSFIEEPQAFNFLEVTNEKPMNIDYEVKLFDLISRLCTLL